MAGFLTNCCVESTMRSGYENGYKVITLSDCVAATSPEEHDNALRYDYPMFSQGRNTAHTHVRPPALVSGGDGGVSQAAWRDQWSPSPSPWERA
jgi:hypothetical protein